MLRRLLNGWDKAWRALMPCALLAVGAVSTNAQSAFSVSDVLIIIDKDVSSPVVYDYSSIYNDTDTQLDMRWIKRIEAPLVPGWDSFFQDPSAWHNPVDGLDSADFVLGPDTSINDKLIFQIGHNLQTGSCQVSFLVFPVNDRSDTIRVTYRVWVSDSPLSTVQSGKNANALLFPNPSDGSVSVADPRVDAISLLDYDGKVVALGRNQDGSWDLLHVSNGTYIVKLKFADGSHAYSRVAVLK